MAKGDDDDDDTMKGEKGRAFLGNSVAAIDAEVCTCDVARGVGKEVNNGAHEVLWAAHVADGDEGCPMLKEVFILVEDLGGAVGERKLLDSDAQWNDGE